MATNPNAYSPLPENEGTGGLTNANTTNAQQKSNFSLIWNFLAYLFGSASGSRKNSFNVLASEGGTFGAAVGVQGDLSVSGSMGAGGNISTLGGVGCNSMTISTNPNGAVILYERNNASSYWAVYTASGAWRVWHNASGDRITVDASGLLVAAGNVAVSSDARLKEDVHTVKNALPRILLSRGVSFKRLGSEDASIGVLAQEAEKIFPELVYKSEKGYLSVNYQGYIGALIESVKELQEQITDLKKQLEEKGH